MARGVCTTSSVSKLHGASERQFRLDRVSVCLNQNRSPELVERRLAEKRSSTGSELRFNLGETNSSRAMNAEGIPVIAVADYGDDYGDIA